MAAAIICKTLGAGLKLTGARTHTAGVAPSPTRRRGLHNDPFDVLSTYTGCKMRAADSKWRTMRLLSRVRLSMEVEDVSHPG